MIRKKLKSCYICIILGLITIAIIFAGVNAGVFKAFAESSSSSKFIGISGSPNGDELFNATNTYDYNGNNNLSDRNYVYYNTSIDGKNNNEVSTETPLITVLTHGLGGNASHWSNVDANFAYDEESMFARFERELLKNNGSGANLYWAVMKNSSEFNLYDLNDDDNRSVKKEDTGLEYIQYEKKKTTNAITDISKHRKYNDKTMKKCMKTINSYTFFNAQIPIFCTSIKLCRNGWA